jgi:hypothetical protein
LPLSTGADIEETVSSVGIFNRYWFGRRAFEPLGLFARTPNHAFITGSRWGFDYDCWNRPITAGTQKSDLML